MKSSEQEAAPASRSRGEKLVLMIVSAERAVVHSFLVFVHIYQ